MRFTPDFIERLKSQLPLSAVIGKRIAVKKFGREYKAICPFHNEKSPSFTINDEKEFYHCFGCGAHGDAIGFLINYEKLSYPEAIERLANEAGIPLPVSSPREEERYQKARSLYELIEESAQWYQKQLMTPAGQEARDYLAQRKISPEMIANFRLGFAPNDRDALKKYLAQKNFTEAMMVESGMIARAEPPDTKTYDRFRNRIMFPIGTANGKLVAFSGRILPSVAEQVRAKYLNSPETPLFKKGDLLYGLHLAKRAIGEKQSAIVVEGNLDVIALHQAGFKHTIAPLGTALTAEQLQSLWRISPEPTLCFDGDSAGSRAMMRAAELALPLMKVGMGLKFALLPEGEDPDTLVSKKGPAAMQAILDKAWSLSQVLWMANENQIGNTSPEQRARLESALMATADKLTDNSLKQHFRDYFKQQMWDSKKPVAKTTAGKTFSKSGFKDKKPEPALALLGSQNKGSQRKRFEEQIFCLLLYQPALLQQVEIEEEFARTHFADMQLDKLRDAILQHHHEAEATSRESLIHALAKNGLSDLGDHITKQAAILIPKTLHSHDVNIHDAALVWHQMMTAYTGANEDSESLAVSEENWERLRERATHDARAKAHFTFPEGD